ncbi:hypothetical protein [Hymenobacter rigui]|uniref:DUF3108 domain-containing protein n=1 Tax=Hymenobacter rigui TaxID=334424 RepID=A0A3R9NJ86_9BACT|nr:hypothetical protein [Hymenobacter rigui]RSK48370.1 hypothetical protein EI291_11655 [Hymenobacter rigui]
MFAAYVLGALSISIHPSAAPDSLVIFRAGRTYEYRAVFINPAGDTLSRGGVTLEATGTPWAAQRKTQKAIRIHYHYTAQDSITFLVYPDPTTKRPDKPKRYSWARTHVTGAIENRQKVWFHPFRDNQYIHTEIAPFPEVWLDSLRSGGQWFNQTTISVGWGKFIGSVRSTYQVVRHETRQYGALSLPGCWLIKSVATHDKLGDSYLDFYFHPQYGFTEMHYHFFDGMRISFVLTQATSRANL